MADFMETEDKRSVIKEKLRQQFDGKIVRKDLTKKNQRGGKRPCLCVGVPSGTVLQLR